MPKEFENCRKQGGNIRTFSGPNAAFGLGKNQYVHVCFLKGKGHRGETKTKKG